MRPPTTSRRLARRGDPISSHLAAEALVASGHHALQQEVVLALVLARPGATAAELAEGSPFDSVQVTRRLNDLRRHGRVEKRPLRTCRLKGRLMLTWAATPRPPTPPAPPHDAPRHPPETLPLFPPRRRVGP